MALALEAMLQQLTHLHRQVSDGDEAARAGFRQDFLQANHSALGAQALADGNYSFERIAYLLADLTEARSLSIHLPDDRPGALRALLDVFERHGVSISSLPSAPLQQRCSAAAQPRPSIRPASANQQPWPSWTCLTSSRRRSSASR